MNKTACSHENETLQAIRSGNLPESLLNHIASCAHCQGTRTAAEALQLLRRQSEAVSHQFPNPQLLWIRAQIARKEEKLSALDLLTLAGMTLLGAAGLIGFLFWRWPQLKHFVGGTVTASMPKLIDVFPVGIPLFVLFAVVAMVLVVTHDYFTARSN